MWEERRVLELNDDVADTAENHFYKKKTSFYAKLDEDTENNYLFLHSPRTLQLED